jgi:hypothetical protein
MSFEEFAAKYPHITRDEIATIAGCSIDLVNRWFMRGRTGRGPTREHMDRLSLADWLWSATDNEPEYVRYIRSVKIKMDDRDDRAALS